MTPELEDALNPYAVLFRYDDEDIVLVSRTEANSMVAQVIAWAEGVLNVRLLD